MRRGRSTGTTVELGWWTLTIRNVTYRGIDGLTYRLEYFLCSTTTYPLEKVLQEVPLVGHRDILVVVVLPYLVEDRPYLAEAPQGQVVHAFQVEDP